MSKHKFWKGFDKIFEGMDEMFKNLDEVIKNEKEKSVTKTIIKKVRGDKGEVSININGSAKAINEITDEIIEIIDEYNKEIKKSRNDNK